MLLGWNLCHEPHWFDLKRSLMRGPIDSCGPIFSSSEASAWVMSSISLIISDSLFEQSHFMRKKWKLQDGPHSVSDFNWARVHRYAAAHRHWNLNVWEPFQL